MRCDLKAAGVAYETAEGVADFHSLRHTYGTIMGKAGVEFSVRQKLMRHSSPLLTNRYTHLGLADLAGSVPALPQQLVSGAGLDAKCSPPQPTAFHLLCVQASPEKQRFGKGKDCVPGRDGFLPTGTQPPPDAFNLNRPT